MAKKGKAPGKSAKSHKGIRKRMKLTPNGKVVRSKANTGHLQSHKSGQRKRRLRRQTTVHVTQQKTYARLIQG
jgi:large subunit ribosomal protein L35